MKKKKFTGQLAKKRKPRKEGELLAAGLRNNQDQLKEIISKRIQEDLEKLKLLCAHYGIQENDSMFYELSLALAEDFVPGFQEKIRSGTKLKWTFMKQIELCSAIELLVDNSHSIDRACEILSNDEPWKSFLDSQESKNTNPDPGEALRQQYYALKKNFPDFVKDKNSK